MNEQEKIEWVKRNYSEKDFDFGMQDLEKSLAKKAAKESRVLRIFKNLDEYHEYAESHHMGRGFNFDPDVHGEHEGCKEFIAVCAYEYQKNYRR